MIDQAAILATTLNALLPAPVRAERAPFVADLSVAIVAASAEATCTGPWEEAPECRRTWPGQPEELQAFVGTLGFFESGFLPRIAAGDCRKWGKRRQDIECDGHIVIEGRTVFKAVTTFQIQGLSLEQRREAVGLGEIQLFEASRQAVRVVSSYWTSCQVADRASCTFTGLAGTISFAQAPLRARVYRKVLAQVRAAE